jgi:Spy/CpxP family protein refolding chaperone
MSTPMMKPRALAAALLTLTLGIGVLAGIAFDRLVLLPTGAEAAEVGGAAPPGADPTRLMARGGPGQAPDARYLDFMVRELGLSEDQQLEVESILQRQQERIHELTRETRPQIRQVAVETRAAVDSVLTPEQRRRLQELREQRDRKHEGTRGQRPGSPPTERGRF